MIVAGDVNGDGKPDLATDGTSAIHTFLNKGGGSFGSPVDTTGMNLGRPVLGDFNGDGKLDAAAFPIAATSSR
jgi:hypothetical protein